MIVSSVIICTKNRSQTLRNCLESLVGQTVQPDELIIVDAGSDDAEEVVRKFEELLSVCDVKYFRSEPGLTRQRNIGIEQATGDIIHFLDDDVILDPSYIEVIEETYGASGNEDVIAVAPRLRVPREPSRAGLLYRRFFMMSRVDGDGRMAPSGFGTLTWYAPYDSPHEIDVGCGCCTYRREVFEHIWFDEHFEGYGYMEDHDFTYRAGRLGRMLYNPRAVMLHDAAPSARLDRRRLVAMQIVNHHYVFKKHLPQDIFHRLCFWWSELGESILRVVAMLREPASGIALGMIDGYSSILRNKHGNPGGQDNGETERKPDKRTKARDE